MFGQPEVGGGLLPGAGDRAHCWLSARPGLDVIRAAATTTPAWPSAGRVTRALLDAELTTSWTLWRPWLASFDKTSWRPPRRWSTVRRRRRDADLVAAYGPVRRSPTLPGFLTRAAGAGALAAEKGLDFEYRMGEYIGIANQQA